MRTWYALLATCLVVCCGGGSGKGGDANDWEEEDAAETDGAPDAVVECTEDDDCDDSDPCTTDTCEVAEGLCGHTEVDADGDGYMAARVDDAECGGSDCDDGDDAIHPDAAPDCEGGGDFDCDTIPDTDEDADGYPTWECGGEDCNDGDADAFPGSLDLSCDEEDRDCNGQADRDNDSDGQDARRCGGDDCDDENDGVYWGAAEIPCDGIDTNCDGVLHAVEDADGDSFPNATCAPPGVEADCDDSRTDTYPGAPEWCDGVDQDCDGDWAEAGADDDGDGHLDEACGGDDCDDTRSDTHGGADEICLDGVDQDCDGSTDGFTIVLGDVAVTTAAVSAEDPSVVWTGSEFAVAWTDRRTGGSHDVWFGRVAHDGTRVGTDVRVSTHSSEEWEASLAWTGSGFGLAWTNSGSSGQARFSYLDAAGTALVSEMTVDSIYLGHDPNIVWSGSEFGVFWIATNYSAGTWEFAFARITHTGSMPSGVTVLRSGTSPFDWGLGLSSAWTGSEYSALMYTSSSGTFETRLARISAGGTVLGTSSSITPIDKRFIQACAWTGSRYGHVYPCRSPWAQRVRFEQFNYDGSWPGTSSTYLNDGTYLAYRVGLVWTGSEFGATWVEDRSGTGYYQFTTINPAGAITTTPARVTTLDVDLYHASEKVAWTGSLFGVAWVNDSTDQVYLSTMGYCD